MPKLSTAVSKRLSLRTTGYRTVRAISHAKVFPAYSPPDGNFTPTHSRWEVERSLSLTSIEWPQSACLVDEAMRNWPDCGSSATRAVTFDLPVQ